MYGWKGMAMKYHRYFLLGVGLVIILMGPTFGLVRAQTQSGTTRGTVENPTGAFLPEAIVTLDNPMTGLYRLTTTSRTGEFVFHNVPFGVYRLKVEADGFRSSEQHIDVQSIIPVVLTIQLSIPGSQETVTVEGDFWVERHSGSTQITFDQNRIQHWPGAQSSSGIQEIIATVPGWSEEDNGLLHSRGVDDGFLFVTDGIPMSEPGRYLICQCY